MQDNIALGSYTASSASQARPLELAETELLNELRKNPGSSDSDLAAAAGISVEEAGAILEDLTRCGLADSERAITPSGFEALEPYKVDNAIILAAGMSRRFAPFSYDMPKGLLVCKGEVLIERQIRQLHEAGISQIIVVVGYLMEQFAYLEDKLGVTLVANDDYAKRNNHSSIYAVRDYLGNSYICSSDNYFTENVFDAYVHDSYYSSVFMPGITPERALTANAEGIIVETEKPARDAWVMYGHAYWSRSFSEKFLKILESEYDRPDVGQWYRETFYIEHLEELPLRIRRYPDGVIYEFNSVDEICAFDEDFLKNAESKVIDVICSQLDCSADDIRRFEPLNVGLTNTSFSFVVRGQKYIYRHPGKSNSEFDRALEKRVTELVAPLGISEEVVAMSLSGWKISRFIETQEPFDPATMQGTSRLAGILRTLHGGICEKDLAQLPLQDPLARIERHFRLIAEEDQTGSFAREYGRIPEHAKILDEFVRRTPFKQVLCHNDVYVDNILVTQERDYLIDWEYARRNDAGFDVSKLFSLAFLEDEESIKDACSLYFRRIPTDGEVDHLLACAVLDYWWWFLWAVRMEQLGSPMGSNILVWLSKAKHYSKMFSERTGIALPGA